MKNVYQLAKSFGITGALGLTIFTTNLADASSITPVTADYSFTVEDKYKGKATRSLTQSNKTWQYTVKAKVAGVASAKQTSTFVMNGNTIVPSEASTTYKLFGVGRTHDISFSNAGKKIVSTYKGKSTPLLAPNRAYDDLSLEMQIRQDLLSQRFDGDYSMVKKTKIEKTPFKKAGKHKITVPAGSFDTVRVDRIHDDKSRSTSFWLAPSLDYLPIKVIQNNDGKKMEMQLTKIH